MFVRCSLYSSSFMHGSHICITKVSGKITGGTQNVSGNLVIKVLGSRVDLRLIRERGEVRLVWWSRVE